MSMLIACWFHPKGTGLSVAHRLQLLRLLNPLMGSINSMGLTLKQYIKFVYGGWNTWVSQFNGVDFIYSFTTNLWWKHTFIRSFHSSVLWLEHSPNAEHFIFPLVMLNPEKHWLVWAIIDLVRWSGKRGLTQCELKWPSFGCLILSVNEWMGSLKSFKYCWP